ncbi:MAG: ATP-dependent metallopeptidase FtsH/Yme1/Tma family protein, partial [Polaromonas sp.]|nr:ATP-dependent metallopeptidase FtsH/Yme1/Tma family protein [Polaromonas sp.]
MDKKQTWNLGYWLIALALLLLLQNLWQGASQTQVVPYSEFEKALSEGLIAEVTVAE